MRAMFPLVPILRSRAQRSDCLTKTDPTKFFDRERFGDETNSRGVRTLQISQQRALTSLPLIEWL